MRAPVHGDPRKRGPHVSHLGLGLHSLWPGGDRARLYRLLIPATALLAVLPMLLTGPSCGHDFDFHLLSWLEAAKQFAHGQYPHWAVSPAFNAGEPRFLFYPPLSWSLGALLGLILPWKLVPAAFTFVALTLSGFTARRLALRYAGDRAATAAAVLYLANPYMLFTAYERTAYGELLAAAWLPLLLQAALASEGRTRSRITALALPVGLLWLTNAPAAVMSCYALAFLTIVRLVYERSFLTQSAYAPTHRKYAMNGALRHLSSDRRRALLGFAWGRLQLAGTTVAGTALGLALSAFYLVPAAYEQRYIQADMATIEGMRIADNTLFHHMPPSPDNLAHDAVLHTASWIALVLLAVLLLAFRSSYGRDRKEETATLFLLTGLIFFLLTPASLVVWRLTPELRFLQFPWRLTALLAAILVVFAAHAFERLKAYTVLITLAGVALLIMPAWFAFHQTCDVEDTVEARTALFQAGGGTEPTDEYTPATADNDALKHGDPPYWLVPVTPQQEGEAGEAVNAAAPVGGRTGAAPEHLHLKLSAPEYLVLNLRQYPGWRITVNGKPAVPLAQVRDDGLTTVLLPAGVDVVDTGFERTGDQSAGLILSVGALLTMAGLAGTRRESIV